MLGRDGLVDVVKKMKAAPVEHGTTLAILPERSRIVRNHDQGALGAALRQRLCAAGLKPCIACGGHFIDQITLKGDGQ